jgi:hypothetical protein
VQDALQRAPRLSGMTIDRARPERLTLGLAAREVVKNTRKRRC